MWCNFNICVGGVTDRQFGIYLASIMIISLQSCGPSLLSPSHTSHTINLLTPTWLHYSISITKVPSLKPIPSAITPNNLAKSVATALQLPPSSIHTKALKKGGYGPLLAAVRASADVDVSWMMDPVGQKKSVLHKAGKVGSPPRGGVGGGVPWFCLVWCWLSGFATSTVIT